MEEAGVDEEELWKELKKAVDGAAKMFVESRITEGEHLKDDLLEKLDGMLKLVDFIAERSPQIVTEYRRRLEEKVKELLGDNTVDESRLLKRCPTFLCCTHGNRVGQLLQVIPLLNLRGPCVSGDAQGCDHQHAMYQKAIKAQVLDSGQGDYTFAQTHFQQDCRDRVSENEVGGVLLVLMGLIVHPVHLRSDRCCR